MIPWDEIFERLDQMGVALTDAARSAVEFAYPLAYRQAIVDGIGSLIYAVLFTVLSYGSYRAVKWCLQKDAYDCADPGPILIGTFIMLAGFVCVVFAAYHLGLAVQNLGNPGWQAVKNLAALVKKV